MANSMEVQVQSEISQLILRQLIIKSTPLTVQIHNQVKSYLHKVGLYHEQGHFISSLLVMKDKDQQQ